MFCHLVDDSGITPKISQRLYKIRVIRVYKKKNSRSANPKLIMGRFTAAAAALAMCRLLWLAKTNTKLILGKKKKLSNEICNRT